MVFMLPQRLIVPLFQRPYVWNEENQWEPLWNDVARVADRLLKQPHERLQPHFLGAVVLQQTPTPVGRMQTRTIIDGQQRLTTLQLMLDALHAELVVAGATTPAARIEPLIVNAEPFRSEPEDRFKVWPTNRDRPGFNAIMGAKPPIDYGSGDAGEGRENRMVAAHRYFAEQARQWLAGGAEDDLQKRAAAIETVARELLQMVVIDLAADENAQEIFETLNARGAKLTAADLIKNFIFQRLLEAGTDVEDAYEKHWKGFETAFWEQEVSLGRLKYPRSSLFLNQWLIARTGEEIVAHEVFNRFKRFADQDAGKSMTALVRQIDLAAGVYHRFIDSSTKAGEIDRLGLFGYRTSVLESEIIKPLALYLLDPQEQPIPEAQLNKTLDVVESWMVRRMLVRASTKSYGQVISELISELRRSGRATAGDVVEIYFAAQEGANRYWPDDREVREELADLPAYRRLGRGRLRMVLEAIEDYLRGWKDGKTGLGGERVARGKYAIEHVMPRKWMMHWPLPDSSGTDERERLIHTFGNLTLLTGKLNSKASNAPWLGEAGKRACLKGHDVLFLNHGLKDCASWDDDAIRQRTKELAEVIIRIWPVPKGHKSHVSRERVPPRQRVGLLDLINAGMLEPGAPLYRRRKKSPEQVGTVVADGRIDIDGTLFRTPSDAASTITGHATNGWWFFLVEPASRRSLRMVQRDYIEKLAVDSDDDDGEDEDDEEEDSELFERS
jgi:hypothetical protein